MARSSNSRLWYGNLLSVRACEHVGMNKNSKEKDISNAAGIILPGVGAFKTAMDNLVKEDLLEPIISFVKSGKVF